MRLAAALLLSGLVAMGMAGCVNRRPQVHCIEPCYSLARDGPQLEPDAAIPMSLGVPTDGAPGAVTAAASRP